jgi:hypothetical protein
MNAAAAIANETASPINGPFTFMAANLRDANFRMRQILTVPERKYNTMIK